VIRELLRLDEVLQPQLRRIHAELLRQDIHRPLDAVGGLGDAERAAIGDAARRLVGVDAVDARCATGKSYEPVTMLKKPAGHFDGSAQASKAPWSAST
jgi:hypothetical protein